jgi:arsenate reductase
MTHDPDAGPQGPPAAFGRDPDAGRRDALLFLCVANSARSQMAEGLIRALSDGRTPVFSAGSAPARTVNPIAVRVMREIGIDIGSHRAKRISDVPAERIATVVTLCAEEVCPVFPGTVRRLHWPLPDPAAVPAASTDEALASFRRVRDELRTRIEALLADQADERIAPPGLLRRPIDP